MRIRLSQSRFGLGIVVGVVLFGLTSPGPVRAVDQVDLCHTAGLGCWRSPVVIY